MQHPQQDGQQRLAFGARDSERWQLLDNLRLLGRSSLSGRVRALVELVGRVAGDEELTWRIDGPPDARDCLCNRLNETPRSIRRAIETAELIGVLAVRRLRRADRSYDRLALSVQWHRLAARDFACLADSRATTYSRATATAADPRRDTGPAADSRPQQAPDPAGSAGKAVRPHWPHGVANVATQARPIWPDGAANLAAQYKQEQANTTASCLNSSSATATAAAPCRDTGPEQAWAAAAEAVQRTGFKSWRSLLRNACEAGLGPDELVKACEDYLANAAKFRGPGALDAWVRNGDWPVEGVLPAQEARSVAQIVTQRREREQREAMASRIVFAGRRAGRPEAEIQAQLAAAGLSW